MNLSNPHSNEPGANELGVTPESPWLGLRSFTESVQDYFYGRDSEIQELFERVRHRTLTVLFGQSGLGKTSLLRAGLIPRLRESGFTPILIRLVHDEAAESLEQQVVRALTKSWPSSIVPPFDSSLWMLFHDPQIGFATYVRNPVLIIDQFEELFTLGEAKRPEDARRFLESLACLAENRPPAVVRAAMEKDVELADRLQFGPQPCKVLLALRDDFLHCLERSRRQMPSMMDNRLELRLLSGPQAYRAVYEPGIKRKSSPIVRPDTARAIVRFVAHRSSDTPLEEIDNVPPLLSLICEQLNARRLAESESEIRAESLAESAPEVLRSFYETAFAAHPLAVREFVEDQLVSASGFRESKTLDTAKIILSNASVSDPEGILRKLVDERLLVIEDRGGIARVELTHDILAPIAAAARNERAEREAQSAAAKQLASERQKRRLFMAVAGIMGLLLVVATASGILAWTKTGEAKTAAQMLQAAIDEQLRQLHRASMADHANAKKAWQEHYNAERAGKAKAGSFSQWQEAVALWSRALELEPTNADALCWLYDTILRRGRANLTLPQWQLSHEDAVTSASFSPDGTQIVTASSDKTARVWDAATGRTLGEPMRHDDSVNSASFSPDGTRIVTASSDKTARVWDASTGRTLGEPMHHDHWVNGASFSPDGSRIVTADSCTAHVWDTATGNALGEPMLHENYVCSASFSTDGSRIVTASDDQTARVWDAATGEALGEPMRHEDSVCSARFGTDGSRIVTADGWTAHVWDTATGRPLGEPMHHAGMVSDASFSPDGTRVVTASADKTARVWDSATGKALGEPMRHDDCVCSARFSTDGSRIVTASDDQTARVWDAGTGKALGEPMRHEDSVHSASFSPDGTRVVTASRDQTARVWEPTTDKALGEPMRHDDLVHSARFSPDGSRIVTASYKTAYVWDTATRMTRGEPMHHQEIVNDANFDPGGSRIVTASGRTARVWDATTGRALGEPMSHEGGVNGASFSPDGRRVVTASSDQTARVWDAGTGKAIGEPMRHEGGVNGASFSPDGTRVVTASSDYSARVWDAGTSRSFGEPMRHKFIVRSASFSPDGSRIVTAGYDRTARVWNVATGKEVGEPMRHQHGVTCASFNADGSLIVTASYDGTARVWNAATGKEMGEPMCHQDTVTCASFSPDGSLIVTASWDGTTRVWILQSRGRVSTIEESRELGNWCRAVASLQFSEEGELEIVPWNSRKKLLANSTFPSGPWKELADWLHTTGPDSKINPNSTVTLRQIAERERDFGTEDSLISALEYDPTVPLARLMLANLWEIKEHDKQERERDSRLLARAAHLRWYELGRQPNDPDLIIRAAELLIRYPEAPVGIGPTPTTARDEAEKLVRRALILDERKYGTEHSRVSRDLRRLAAILSEDGRAAESEPLIRRALTIDENVYPENHEIIAMDLRGLATSLVAADRHEDAEPLLRRSLAIYCELSRGSKGMDSNLILTLGEYTKLLSQLKLGETDVDNRLATFRLPPQMALDVNIAGVEAFKSGDFAVAVGLFNEGLRLCDQLPEKEKNELKLLVEVNLASAQRENGQVEIAKTSLEKAIVELDNQSEKPRSLKGRARFHLAVCEQNLNHLESAERWVLESVRQYDSLNMPDDDYVQRVRRQSVELYRQLLNDQGTPPVEIEERLQKLTPTAEKTDEKPK